MTGKVLWEDGPVYFILIAMQNGKTIWNSPLQVPLATYTFCEIYLELPTCHFHSLMKKVKA